MSYFDELSRAMLMLAEHPRAIFLGQGVGVNGTTMSPSFEAVPLHKRLEYPVAEEMQCGHAVGAALAGYLPICVYPRWNFVLRAADQIVNHLDALPLYSAGGYKPKVIIRVAVPNTHPFNPGPQHDGDFSDAFAKMLRTVEVVRLRKTADIVPGYRNALEVGRSSIMVEYAAMYKEM